MILIWNGFLIWDIFLNNSDAIIGGLEIFNRPQILDHGDAINIGIELENLGYSDYTIYRASPLISDVNTLNFDYDYNDFVVITRNGQITGIVLLKSLETPGIPN